jgi:hypothetical protein
MKLFKIENKDGSTHFLEANNMDEAMNLFAAKGLTGESGHIEDVSWMLDITSNVSQHGWPWNH